MTYTVIWQPTAQDQLTDLWTAAPDRAAVAEAADRIDVVLARRPLDTGESRAGDDRIVFDRPLAVTFRVDVERGVVLVLSVGRASRRS